MRRHLFIFLVLVVARVAAAQTAASAQKTLPPPHTARPSDRWQGAAREVQSLAEQAETLARRQSPQALAALYRLWANRNLAGSDTQVRQTIEAIASTKMRDPFLRAHANALVAIIRRMEGDIVESQRRCHAIGHVTEALLLGPLDNAAGRGHAAVFPPESALDVDAPVEGKNRVIQWRQHPPASVSCSFAPSAFMHDAKDSTAYLLFVVEAQRATRAAIRTGSNDAIKVFVNGSVVTDTDHARQMSLDQDEGGTTLNAGANLVLVKTSWRGDQAAVFVRLTDPDGHALRGIRVLADAASIRKAIQQHATRKLTPPRRAPFVVATPLSAIDAAISRAERGRSADLADLYSYRATLIDSLRRYDQRKAPPPPQIDVENAILLQPSRPAFRVQLAAITAARDSTQAREQLEAGRSADERHALAASLLGQIALATEQTLKALAYFEDAVRNDPELEVARLQLANLRARSTVEWPQARSLLEEVPKDKRSAYLWAELASINFAHANRGEAEQAARAALLHNRTHEDTRRLLIDIAVAAGRIDEAKALAREAVELFPFSQQAVLRWARLCASPGTTAGFSEALSVLDGAARIFTESVAIRHQQAELALLLGNTPRAIVALDESLSVDGQQTGTRRHRAFLAKDRRELEDTYSGDPQPYLEAPVSDAETRFGYIRLLDRSVTQLYENGQTSRFVQTIARLRKKELRDALRLDAISYSPSRERVEVLTADRMTSDGDIIKARSIRDEGSSHKVDGMYLDVRAKRIEFDDLEPGDLVHLRYRVDSIGTNLFGGFFGDIVGPMSAAPKRRWEYVIEHPPQMSLATQSSRMPAPEAATSTSATVLRWAIDDVPALDAESHAPPYFDIAPTLSVSTYKTWDDLGRWYAKLFAEQMELDEEARALGRRAVGDATDPREKIRRLYNHVVKHTRYVGIELGIHGWKPFLAAEVSRRRYGDCKDKATLLAALLRDNGIEATIALVRTADRGNFFSDHATMWAFNHAITYVPSIDAFLDGTAEYSGMNELPWQDQDAFTLVVYPDGRSQLLRPKLSAAAANTNESSYSARIDEAGTLYLDGDEQYTGEQAARIRRELKDPRTRRERIEQALSSLAPGARVDDATFSDLSDLDRAPTYRYRAELARYASVDAEQIVVPLTLFRHEAATSYALLVERKHDVFLPFPSSTRNTVRYQLPRGSRIESLPDGRVIDTPYISLHQTVTPVDGGFVTDDTFTIKARRIPRSGYAAFRQACLAIDRALERKVVIRR